MSDAGVELEKDSIRQSQAAARIASAVGRVVAALAILAAAAGLPAQERVEEQQATPISTVVVPIVGTVDGANNVRWRTRIQLVNETGQEATIALQLPTAPDQPAIVTSLPAGGSMLFHDVIGEAFGMSDALSPLVVNTMARRSVTVRAEAYPTRGTEQIPAQPIAVDYGATFYPLRMLSNLSFSDEFRTNVGLVNLSEREAVFSLAVQRLPGRNLAVSRLTLPPLALAHVPLQILFPMITKGDHFTVIVETSVPETHLYASVIENATSRATFIRPTIGSPAN